MIVDNLPFLKICESDEYFFEPYGELKNYKRLKKQLGPTWKYYDSEKNPLKTTINELGYRSKTVYPTDEYYIALGCSNTFGQYLHEEDRYSNIIEEKTGVPVINLGVSGGSAFFVMANIAKIIYSSYVKPKAIFIQWPEQNRISTIGDNRPKLIHPHMTNQNVFRYFFEWNCLEQMSKFYYDLTHDICKIPIIEFAVWNSPADFYNVDNIRRVDSARDNEHCGTQTNKNVARYILDRLDYA